MSCRRRDRTRLVGCHVGPGPIIGCVNETNGGDYERLIVQERYTFGPKYFYGAYAYANGEELVSHGRHPCINPHRLKFVCTDCRRSFKQAIVDGQEYDIDHWGHMHRVSPPDEKIKDVWERYWEIAGKDGRKDDERARELRDREYKYYCEGEEAFTKEELMELRKVSPSAHWYDMHRGAKCPQCGKKGVSVGGTFRPCAQDDDKGWERIKEMLGDGEDFCYCMTEEEQNEVIKEGRRLKEREKDKDAWTEEKNRRIRELKEAGQLGQRTKLEQERLQKIRGEKEVGEQ